MKKKETSTTNKVALGAGIAALAVAGIAGAYFLYGKNGAKNRKKISSWMLKAKGEALEKIEKLKDINEDVYNMTVDTIADKYNKLKNTTPEEIAQFTKEMKSHWKSIKKDLAPKAKKVAKKATTAKKVVAKTAAKTVKKAVAKTIKKTK
jgi:gas vesicle protein